MQPFGLWQTLLIWLVRWVAICHSPYISSMYVYVLISKLASKAFLSCIIPGDNIRVQISLYSGAVELRYQAA